MQINSLSRPGCLVALVLSHHKAKVGEGRREHEKRKRRGGGKKHEIPFVLTTKAIRRAGREENRHPREVEECSTTSCPGKG